MKRKILVFSAICYTLHACELPGPNIFCRDYDPLPFEVQAYDDAVVIEQITTQQEIIQAKDYLKGCLDNFLVQLWVLGQREEKADSYVDRIFETDIADFKNPINNLREVALFKASLGNAIIGYSSHRIKEYTPLTMDRPGMKEATSVSTARIVFAFAADQENTIMHCPSITRGLFNAPFHMEDYFSSLVYCKLDEDSQKQFDSRDLVCAFPK